MTNDFDKAQKGLGIRAATAGVKVNIRERLLKSGMIVANKFPGEDNGISEM